MFPQPSGSLRMAPQGAAAMRSSTLHQFFNKPSAVTISSSSRCTSDTETLACVEPDVASLASAAEVVGDGDTQGEAAVFAGEEEGTAAAVEQGTAADKAASTPTREKRGNAKGHATTKAKTKANRAPKGKATANAKGQAKGKANAVGTSAPSPEVSKDMPQSPRDPAAPETTALVRSAVPSPRTSVETDMRDPAAIPKEQQEVPKEMSAGEKGNAPAGIVRAPEFPRLSPECAKRGRSLEEVRGRVVNKSAGPWLCASCNTRTSQWC